VNVVFLGPPGAGKGTQAKAVSDEAGAPHISTGDILREAVANGTPLGLKARGFMDSGALVPDELVVSMVAERLSRDDCDGGFVLDGFPRTIAQAEALTATLDGAGRALDAVVYFRVDDEQVVTRLSGRRICRECGANYHVEFMPAARQGVCDKCEGALYQRDDDRAETVRERLKVYYAQTADLIDYYRGRGLLREVDASRSPSEVTGAVRAALDSVEGQ
jgi:adenylate kinase